METIAHDNDGKYRSIIESLQDLFVRTTPDGTILEVNSAVARLLGFEKEEVIGRCATDWYVDPKEREALVRMLLESGSVSDFEVRIRKRDGTHLNFSVNSRLVGDKQGGNTFIESILRDITFRKQAEERMQLQLQQLTELNGRLQEAQAQLIQSEKMASIGQLAAGVAHEINNPIGYVNSNLRTLDGYIKNLFDVIRAYEQAEQSIADDEVRRRLAQFKNELDLDYLKEDVLTLMGESREGLERVKKIVQDLKEFSHAGDGDEWQWVDIHKGLESTLNIVWSELKYKADVVKNYSDLPNVQCLSSQINQVFMNILVNASHAIEKRGTIIVSTSADEAEIQVKISDNGKGIAPEHLGRVFEPFFTTKPVGKGTGLGLSLSYAIVKKHHGRIEVESTPGAGTTFTITLPIRQEDSADAEPARGAVQ
jgi:PAS domain S-box-containing protein